MVIRYCFTFFDVAVLVALRGLCECIVYTVEANHLSQASPHRAEAIQPGNYWGHLEEALVRVS